jgi:hypothetical protein
MKQEECDEQIEVIAYFGIDERRPLRFRMGQQVIKIASTNGYWNRHQGATALHYWAVSDESGNYYELEMNGETMQWRLVKMVTDV